MKSSIILAGIRPGCNDVKVAGSTERRASPDDMVSGSEGSDGAYAVAEWRPWRPMLSYVQRIRPLQLMRAWAQVRKDAAKAPGGRLQGRCSPLEELKDPDIFDPIDELPGVS